MSNTSLWVEVPSKAASKAKESFDARPFRDILPPLCCLCAHIQAKHATGWNQEEAAIGVVTTKTHFMTTVALSLLTFTTTGSALSTSASLGGRARTNTCRPWVTVERLGGGGHAWDGTHMHGVSFVTEARHKHPSHML